MGQNEAKQGQMEHKLGQPRPNGVKQGKMGPNRAKGATILGLSGDPSRNGRGPSMAVVTFC